MRACVEGCLGQSNDSIHLSAEGLRNFEQNVSQKMPINSVVNVLWECVRIDCICLFCFQSKQSFLITFLLSCHDRIFECFILEQHFIEDCV